MSVMHVQRVTMSALVVGVLASTLYVPHLLPEIWLMNESQSSER